MCCCMKMTGLLHEDLFITLLVNEKVSHNLDISTKFTSCNSSLIYTEGEANIHQLFCILFVMHP